MDTKKYLPVIGLEIHVELKTLSKMFCGCDNDYFGQKPNSRTCPTCLGLPGALPVPNQKAIEYCLKIALALNCSVSKFSYFERKNYFYPDLTKGYQISQYKTPFGKNGFLEMEENEKRKKIRINRVHLEEDTGKIIHTFIDGEKVSLLDFNRAGVPLVEIVTEPDISSGKEAKTFLTALYKIIKYLDVSDADMEKGEMRLEPNISVKIKSQETKTKNELPDYKVEVKNINSFRFAEKAINYEIERQGKILAQGAKPVQETRGWDEIKNQTVSQRLKEEAHDYRYFPEPDIPPINLTGKEILNISAAIPELPLKKSVRFIKDYGLSYYASEIITRSRETADFFEETCKVAKEHNLSPKEIANLLINKNIDTEKTVPAQLVKMLLEEKDKSEIDNDFLEQIIEKILAKETQAVADYKKGKQAVIGFLMGITNRELKGKKVDPQKLKEKIEKKIK